MNMLKNKIEFIKNIKTMGLGRLIKYLLIYIERNVLKLLRNPKDNYLFNLCSKLANNCTGQKTYWKIVINLLNKYKIPRIPPLLIADKFVTSWKKDAQCQPLWNMSVLPNFYLLTAAKLDSCEITNEQI